MSSFHEGWFESDTHTTAATQYTRYYQRAFLFVAPQADLTMRQKVALSTVAVLLSSGVGQTHASSYGDSTGLRDPQSHVRSLNYLRPVVVICKSVVRLTIRRTASIPLASMGSWIRSISATFPCPSMMSGVRMLLPANQGSIAYRLRTIKTSNVGFSLQLCCYDRHTEV